MIIKTNLAQSRKFSHTKEELSIHRNHDGGHNNSAFIGVFLLSGTIIF